MTFETPSGVAAWKAANVSHDQWNDWADWFERPVAPRFVVDAQLGELRKLHDPKGHGYFVLDEQEATVDFAFDTGEATVRDCSGTIAAALRAAAEHGARGTFYFLGTAGAEYDFTYKLELANGLSTMETLHEREIATVYQGDQYQAFMQRVREALGITADEIVEHAPAAADAEDTEREALKSKASAFTASKAQRKASVVKAAEPTAVEPAAEEAAANEEVADAAVAAEAPAAKQPAAKATAANKPAVKAAAKTPAAKPPAVKTPAVKTPAANKPAAKTPAANKPAANKPAAKKPTTKKPTTKKPAASKP